jgi:hypothetical protein
VLAPLRYQIHTTEENLIMKEIATKAFVHTAVMADANTAAVSRINAFKVVIRLMELNEEIETSGPRLTRTAVLRECAVKSMLAVALLKYLGQEGVREDDHDTFGRLFDWTTEEVEELHEWIDRRWPEEPELGMTVAMNAAHYAYH